MISLSTIGLARKAGALVIGSASSVEAVRKNKAELVIISADTGAAIRKKITDKCVFYETDFLEVPYSMEELSRAAGYKTPVSVLTITDKSFLKIRNTNSEL